MTLDINLRTTNPQEVDKKIIASNLWPIFNSSELINYHKRK